MRKDDVDGEKILESVDKLREGLENAKTLRIHNNASKTSRLDQARHERGHARTLQMSDQELQGFWDTLVKEQQEAITTDIQQSHGSYIDEKSRKQEAVDEV